MMAKIIDFTEELIANDLSQEDEFKYKHYSTIYFDLSCIEDEESYKKELMRFDYPTSLEIKEFFSKLNELNLKCEHSGVGLTCKNKYATININSIYYSYDTFELKIKYSIRGNKLGLVKINIATFADLFIEFKEIKNLNIIIRRFNDQGYSLSSTYITDAYWNIEFNDGDIICLFNKDGLKFSGCKVRVSSLYRHKYIKYNGEFSIFMSNISGIYSKYLENRLNRDATCFLSKYMYNQDEDLSDLNSITHDRLMKKLNYINSGLISHLYTAKPISGSYNVIYSKDDINIYILNIKVANHSKKTGNTMSAIICGVVDNKIYTLDGDVYTYSNGKFVSTHSGIILNDIELLRATIPSGYMKIMNIV